ncbi:SDR family NAD(P)-dependent oxidoreductase [Aureispira anguillae]|uniref:SDR family NAD(P)-dependent oxidoreductase n=1 Tax=Aureispira anguillae TaxID=2864201 RepID=A0A915VK47_9BACT|nr:SDR family NAD(P)-dependent oxidoreductase [Aureispira anguillae]BDS09516.1 SDR family NAD(P)-dependent oxidoreductase [Aureispira anguillae]
MITARSAEQLLEAKNKLSNYTQVVAISGDVRDEIHLLELADVLGRKGWKLDLVVNNASYLGESPMKKILEHSIDSMHLVLHTNMIAPISLLQKLQSFLNPKAKIINVSSDAAKEIYETWGIYGAAKAGLDHLTAVLGIEYPQFYFYAFDPGDMRTDMHQDAFPNEDISDRPLPQEFAVPALLQLIQKNVPSGRYSFNAKMTENYEHTNQ